MLRLFQVGSHEIDLAWKHGAGVKLGEAIKRASREVTLSQLKLLLARGERILLGVREENGPPLGWCVLSISQLPNIRVLYVWDIAASGATGQEAFELLKGYARAHGCSSIRGACDRAVSRLWERRFNAKYLYQIMEIEVD